MPTYGPMGYGNYPYMQQPNYQGGIQPNFYPNIPNPQQPTQQQQQLQYQTHPYSFVNGIEGAKAFPMQPNQNMMLVDSNYPLQYLKTSNAMGQAGVRYFKTTEISEAEAKEIINPSTTPATPAMEYATKEDLQLLTKQVNKLQKSFNSLNDKPKEE